MFYDLGMDTTKMTDARTALICARLRLRGGKRRLQKGLTAAGMVALYDSILFGMRYYMARHERCASFLKTIEPWDAMSMFQALTRAGVFADPLTFNRFSLIVERTLWQGSSAFDANAVLTQVEEMLATLGVMPFSAGTPRRKPARSD
jgi:hypothetical protein